MVKHGIDFRVIENISWERPTLEEIQAETAAAVAREVERIQEVIKAIDSKHAHNPRLVSFADYSNPGDYTVRYQAMVKIFEMFNVADAYFRPYDYPEQATMIVDDDNDWDLTLRRPDGKGTFKVTFVNNAPPIGDEEKINAQLTGRQTVYYKPGV